MLLLLPLRCCCYLCCLPRLAPLQGTLASAGEDIPAAIQLLAPHIKYVHFRDVVGTVCCTGLRTVCVCVCVCVCLGTRACACCARLCRPPACPPHLNLISAGNRDGAR